MILIQRNVKPPTITTIGCLGRSVVNSLFNKIFDGHNIKYRKQDRIALLNHIGNNNNMIPELKRHWEDTLLASFSSKEAVQDMSVRGNKTQQHNKQAIMSGMVVLRENELL